MKKQIFFFCVIISFLVSCQDEYEKFEELGDSKMKNKDYEGAIIAFLKASHSNPEISDLVNSRIRSDEFKVGRTLVAAKLYSGAIKTKIDDIVGRLERNEITPGRSIVELNALGIPPVLQKEVRDASKASRGANPTPVPNPLPPNPVPLAPKR